MASCPWVPPQGTAQTSSLHPGSLAQLMLREWEITVFTSAALIWDNQGNTAVPEILWLESYHTFFHNWLFPERFITRVLEGGRGVPKGEEGDPVNAGGG